MGWGILKLYTELIAFGCDMFSDVSHCCFLISNPVYLIVDCNIEGVGFCWQPDGCWLG